MQWVVLKLIITVKSLNDCYLIRKRMLHVENVTQILYFLVLGKRSYSPEKTVSKSANSESSPRSSSMKKKRNAQSGETARRLTASGYAMKARP